MYLIHPFPSKADYVPSPTFGWKIIREKRGEIRKYAMLPKTYVQGLSKL
jgi:hypothetical protein